MTTPRIKQGKASLVGGIAVGIAVLILWVAVARELDAGSVAVIVVGVLIAAAVASWIRLADL